MKIVLATGNKNKIKEIKEKFSSSGSLEISSLEELDTIPEIDENASTFEGNALIKAEAICRLTGLPAIADDSGLVIDALNGEPGVYSARYGGDNLSDTEKNELVLSKMEGIPEEKRSARFVCVIAIALPDKSSFTVEGICPGLISSEPAGSNGFGYDPIFYIPESGKTMAQLTPEEKNRISHRGKALEKAYEVIKEITGSPQ
jgi:XTP/dITP diphosphohydrolase